MDDKRSRPALPFDPTDLARTHAQELWCMGAQEDLCHDGAWLDFREDAHTWEVSHTGFPFKIVEDEWGNEFAAAAGTDAILVRPRRAPNRLAWVQANSVTGLLRQALWLNPYPRPGEP